MPDAPVTHPNAKDLSDFGLGKLPRPMSDSVAAHLESCSDCLAKLAEQQPDSFMGGLKAAAPKNGTLVPGEKAPALMPKKAPPPADLPPELAAMGKFEDVRKVGEGGMGAVWKARHVMLDKLVAIKVMNSATLGNAEARERFFTEMRAGGKLDHPNIARVIDAGRAGELLYMVMEYVEGQSLDKYIARKGPMPVHLACDLVAQAAEGLQHAFEKGMAHRDIKPANLMVTREAKVRLLDFGLVRIQEDRERKTRFQAFMGTADYIAPEQATNARSADVRADIYSLGCTLYFLLSGRPPFSGESYIDVIAKHLTDPPAPLTGVPAPLWAVVARMMEKDPERRYQTPAEVVEALQPFRTRAAALGDSGPAAVVPPLPAPSRQAESSPFTDLPAEARAEKRCPPQARKGGPGRMLWGAVAAGAAVTLLAVGVVLTLQTKHGEVVIKLSDPNAKVEVKIDGDKIELSGLSRPLKMTVGEHGLTVVADGFETVTKSFVVNKGAKTEVDVKLTPKPVVIARKDRDIPDREAVEKKDAPRPAPNRKPEDKGFVSLFNGKDLTGWQRLGPEEPGAWTVQDGILSGRSHNWSSLRSERADYSDFHLRVEAMVDGAGGSVRFRHPLSGKPGPFVAQIVTDGPLQTGSLLRKTLPALHCSWWNLVVVPTAAAPANTWVNLEAIAVDDRVTIKVNGNTTADVRQRDNQRAGHFTLYPERGSGIKFRKIEVKELPEQPVEPEKTPAKPKPPADAVPYSGKKYKAFTENLSWTEARDRCKKASGRLAIIKSAGENAFVQRLVTEANLQEAWLGGTDEVQEGKWVWVDGTPFKYTNWGLSQPNNKNNNEHYVLIITKQGGKWSDQPNQSTQHRPGYVCEWSEN
jgi:tRNA A-37 threonylcarbamoyl transferase component Bud32